MIKQNSVVSIYYRQVLRLCMRTAKVLRKTPLDHRTSNYDDARCSDSLPALAGTYIPPVSHIQASCTQPIKPNVFMLVMIIVY